MKLLSILSLLIVVSNVVCMERGRSSGHHVQRCKELEAMYSRLALFRTLNPSGLSEFLNSIKKGNVKLNETAKRDYPNGPDTSAYVDAFVRHFKCVREFKNFKSPLTDLEKEILKEEAASSFLGWWISVLKE